MSCDKNTKMSIVIPVYNGEKYISECIESIINADWGGQVIEIIVVNDGSKDNTLDILNKYADFVKIISTPNNGVSAARNVGIENATGEFLTFVDSDDILIKGWDNILKKAISVNSDLYIFNVYNEKADHSITLVKRELGEGEYTKGEDIDYFWVMDFIPGVWDKVFRLDIVKKYGIRFIEGMKSGEDNLFVREYLTHCHNYYVSTDAYYLYRYNVSSVSHSTLFKNYSDFHRVITARIDCALTLLNGRDKALNAIIRSFLNRFLWSKGYADTKVCQEDYIQIEKEYDFVQYISPNTVNQWLNLILFKVILKRLLPSEIIISLYSLKKRLIEKRT